MPVQRLPFPGPLDKNLLDTIVKQGSVELWNGYIDQTGAIYKRPGLVLNQTPSVSYGVTGMYWWEAKRRFTLTGDGHVFYTLSPAANFQQVNEGTNVHQAGKIQFADSGYWLLMASESGPMLGWDGTNPATIEPDTVAPTNVCSVAFFKGRFYAVQTNTARIWYTQAIDSTDPAKRLAWEGYIDVRRTGDPVLAIQDMGAELLVMKSSSIETYYYDDSIESIRPVEGSLRETGLLAPRAFKLIGGILYFVTNKQQIAAIENREIKVISGWVDSLLQAFPVTSDAFVVQADRFILFQFPSPQVDQTVVFDIATQGWYRWSDFSLLKHKMFPVTCSAYQPGGANHWLLGGSDNCTYFLDPNSFWDNGTMIRFSVRSLHYDHGTHNRKLATRMTAKVALDNPRLGLTAFQGRPVPEPPGLPEATRCTAYSYTFPDYSTDYYTVSVVNLPAGLTYDGTTRTISGTVPCQVGDFTVGVYLTDERGASFRFARTLTVLDFDITLTFAE